jgi:hypothetical protein
MKVVLLEIKKYVCSAAGGNIEKESTCLFDY